MLRATCHCGAVAISIPRPPEKVTNCNCSICRRYGTLWGYFEQPEVLVEAAPGATHEYSWGDNSLAFVRCAVTGIPIPLEELKYWSVDRQEAYATPEAVMRREAQK